MRLFRLLLLFGLFAYAWMACSLSTVAIVIANQGHHTASLQFTADSVTMMLQHGDHAHEHDDGDAHSSGELPHPDHVLKLPQAKDVASATDAGKPLSGKWLAATFESISSHNRLATIERLISAQPPPLARSNAVELRAFSVILI